MKQGQDGSVDEACAMGTDKSLLVGGSEDVEEMGSQHNSVKETEPLVSHSEKSSGSVEEVKEPASECREDGDRGVSRERESDRGQPVVKTDHLREARRSKTPTLRPPLTAPVKQQRSLASLFAQQLKKENKKKTVQSQQVTADTSTDTTEPLTQSETVLSTVSSSLPSAPKLSSLTDFVLGDEAGDATESGESRVLTPLENFQQRLLQQMNCSQPPKTRGNGGVKEMVLLGEVVGEEGNGEAATCKPLISEDVILKLKDKPGEKTHYTY